MRDVKRAIWRRLCRRGKHDLQPLIAPGCVNIGTCRRCGTIHVLQHGEPAQWIDTAAPGSTGWPKARWSRGTDPD